MDNNTGALINLRSCSTMVTIGLPMIHPSREQPPDQRPTDERPTDKRPADERQADERLADERSNDEGPTDERATDGLTERRTTRDQAVRTTKNYADERCDDRTVFLQRPI